MRTTLLVAVALSLLCVRQATTAQAAERLSAVAEARMSQRDATDIADGLGRQDLVRIIVELDWPGRGAAWPSGGAALERLKERTANLQRRAIARHFGVAASRIGSSEEKRRAITRMLIEPMFAVDATRPEIERLARDGGVVRLHLDRLESASLDASTAFVGMAGESGAWAVRADGDNAEPNVPYTIAILDSGVAVGHPFLPGRVAAQDMCFSTTSPASGSTSFCSNGGPQMFGTNVADAC